MNLVKNLFKDRETLKKCIIVVVILALLRLCYSIPTPFANPGYFKTAIETNASLGILNLFTGNGLSSLSVMTLSISPYITASIIIQLMGVVIPRIAQMQKGLKDERDKLNRATLILGAVLGFLEGIALAIGFGRQGMLTDTSWYAVLIVAAVWTAGCVAASCCGKFISDKLIGNGISLILLTNICAGFLSNLVTVKMSIIDGRPLPAAIIFTLTAVVIVIGLFTFAAFVHYAEKRIPVNYSAKGVSGSNKAGKIPIKLCPGTVVPMIFASSIMTLPGIIAGAFGANKGIVFDILNTSKWFDLSNMLPTIGVVIYVLLIFGCSFFYNDITLNPEEIANDLKKNAGVIPGIRPGKPTAEYLRKKMKGTTLLGALFLSIVALIPIILGGLFKMSYISFFGTSTMIIVSVLIETKKTLESSVMVRNYTAGSKQKRELFRSA